MTNKTWTKKIKTINEYYIFTQNLYTAMYHVLYTYPLAVVGGISSTHQVLVGPTIQIRIFSTDKAISSITNFTLTFVHRVTEVAKVNALSRLMTTMGLVLARVLRFTNLLDLKDGRSLNLDLAFWGLLVYCTGVIIVDYIWPNMIKLLVYCKNQYYTIIIDIYYFKKP